MSSGVNQRTASGKMGTAAEKGVGSGFEQNPARSTEPAVGASVWAYGSRMEGEQGHLD